MSAKLIVEEIRRTGGAVTLDGEALRFKAPSSWTTPERELALVQLRANKHDIIAYLVSEERYVRPAPVDLAACGNAWCAGCYAVGNGAMIHPPRSAYHYDGV
jgi:hypothetical protein